MSDSTSEDPRHTELWREFEDTNGKGFWAIDPDRSPDEHDKPSLIENLIETVVLHPVSEPAEKRPIPHRHRRRRGVRGWLPVLALTVVGCTLVGTAWAAGRTATPPRGKTTPDPIRITVMSLSPTPVPGPTQTRWRTREVKVPGPVKYVTLPTVRVTVTVTPAPKTSVRPGPTVTVTETETADDPFNPNP